MLSISMLGLPLIVFLLYIIFNPFFDFWWSKKIFVPVKPILMDEIVGDWHFYNGERMYFSDSKYPYTFFLTIDSSLRKDWNKFYLAPYRFHISKDTSANFYNILFEYKFALLAKFDFSDAFLHLAKGSVEVNGYSMSIKSKNDKINSNGNPHYFFYLGLNLFEDDSHNTVYAQSSFDRVGIYHTKNNSINFPLDENLVLYSELYSIEKRSVKVLSLAGIDLETIPEKLKNFLHIKKLFMPFNKVKFTDADWEVLESLPNLEVLDIRNNELSASSDPNLSRLKNLKSLKKLYMAGKNVLQNCKLSSGIYDIASLETLSVGQFENFEISPELTKLKNLKALRFYLSNIKTLPPEPLRNITWYYNCTFDPSIPEKDLPKFKHPKFSEILMHEEH